jgi:hypothetical protein
MGCEFLQNGSESQMSSMPIWYVYEVTASLLCHQAVWWFKTLTEHSYLSINLRWSAYQMMSRHQWAFERHVATAQELDVPVSYLRFLYRT